MRNKNEISDAASRLGKIGGAAIKNKYQKKDKDYFKKLGAKGGQKTKKRGPEYFRNIGKKGANARLLNK